MFKRGSRCSGVRVCAAAALAQRGRCWRWASGDIVGSNRHRDRYRGRGATAHGNPVDGFGEDAQPLGLRSSRVGGQVQHSSRRRRDRYAILAAFKPLARRVLVFTQHHRIRDTDYALLLPPWIVQPGVAHITIWTRNQPKI